MADGLESIISEEKKKEKKYVVFLPSLGVNVEGYFGIPKIGGTWAASRKQAISHYLFRFTKRDLKENPVQPPISERSARIMMNVLNNKFDNFEKFAYEVPEFYQDENDLRQGARIDRKTFDMHRKLKTFNYFESVHRRILSENEYNTIEKVLKGFGY